MLTLNGAKINWNLERFVCKNNPNLVDYLTAFNQNGVDSCTVKKHFDDDEAVGLDRVPYFYQ